MQADLAHQRPFLVPGQLVLHGRVGPRRAKPQDGLDQLLQFTIRTGGGREQQEQNQQKG